MRENVNDSTTKLILLFHICNINPLFLLDNYIMPYIHEAPIRLYTYQQPL